MKFFLKDGPSITQSENVFSVSKLDMAAGFFQDKKLIKTKEGEIMSVSEANFQDICNDLRNFLFGS